MLIPKCSEVQAVMRSIENCALQVSDFGLPRKPPSPSLAVPTLAQPVSSFNRIGHHAHSVMSAESHYVGSLATWAPELLSGASYSKASDVYAFGTLLCEVIYGLSELWNALTRKKNFK